jgi:coenzyme F420-reducing hydrogenase delta subunit/NAD-dependent dihydropyrimidine dehydrogenase PreA subunit
LETGFGRLVMTEHADQVEVSVKIDDAHCGRCTVCSSVCPFDAITVAEGASEPKLDLEKCQVCGICSSACPASAIETIYYDADSLLSYVSKHMSENGSNRLALSCRDSGFSQKRTIDRLGEQQQGGTISVVLPCVGRLPPEFLFKALGMGIKKLILVPCEDAYCRFRDGSMVGTRRFLLARATLSQLGFEPDALTLVKKSIKAHIDSSRCIGCGNCSYVCAYSAIKMGVPKVAQLNVENCSGCGACVTVCPALAIGLDGFEHESISQTIHDYGSSIPEIRMKTGKPAILVLSCHWSEFRDFDVGKDSILENAALIGLPCAGRVDDLHVIEGFHSGFDGVLVAACKKNECKLEKGNEKAEQRISSLRRLLSQLGLERKLEMCFVSPRDLGSLNNHIKLFTEKLSLSSTNEVT